MGPKKNRRAKQTTQGGRVTRASTAGGENGAGGRGRKRQLVGSQAAAASRVAASTAARKQAVGRQAPQGSLAAAAEDDGVVQPTERGRQDRRVELNEGDSNSEKIQDLVSVDEVTDGDGESRVLIEEWRQTKDWKRLSGKGIYLKHSARELVETIVCLQSKDVVDDELVSVKLAVLAGVGKDLKDLRGDVLNYLAEQTIPSLVIDLEMREFVQLEESILRVNRREQQAGKLEANLGPGPSRNRRSLLPDMQPTKFSGNISDWVTWWPQYEVIHSDTTINDVTKFRYLFQCIQQGTQAYRTLERYPLTPANYPKVIQELKDLYGNPEEIINKLVLELTELATAAVKSPINVMELYEELDSRMKALGSLGWIASDYSGLLYPVIKNALPRASAEKWESQKDEIKESAAQKGRTSTNMLTLFMEFLKKEARVVQVLQRSNVAESSSFANKRSFELTAEPVASVSGLLNPEKKNQAPNPKKKLKTQHSDDPKACAFGDGNHLTRNCWNATKMSIQERRNFVRKANLCFKCLRSGHREIKCRVNVKCTTCHGPHAAPMCVNGAGSSKPKGVKRDRDEEVVPVADPPKKDTALLSVRPKGMETPLQTVKVLVGGPTKWKIVRAALDSGATKSTILKKTAEELSLTVEKKARVQHLLFGGGETKAVQHNIMSIDVRSLDGQFGVRVSVMDQERIVGRVINEVSDHMKIELAAANISLSDVRGDEEIELLLGNDVYGLLLTGEVKYLGGGVTAIGTKFGPILSGPCEEISTSEVITPLLLSALSVEQMSDLSVLGIKDPIATKSRAEVEEAAKEFFRQTVSRTEDGRYRVKLPKVLGMDKLSDNKMTALRRLRSLVKKAGDHFDTYDAVLAEWEREGVTSLVPKEELEKEGCHYLPHQMVLKEGSSTTKVRPVFDASCKSSTSLSLNDTLMKGPNMLERIPDLLMRFREGRFGATADLKKAFLQIEVEEEDRDLLRFFWMERDRKTIKVYRHNRVVFGVKPSPFQLMAVLEIHLEAVKGPDEDIAKALLKAFYVDNVVIAFEAEEDYRRFKEVSVKLMAAAGFDLRLWESNIEGEVGESIITKVLGLDWDKINDTLRVAAMKMELPKKMTKRAMLSAAQAVYDPLGMVVPVTLLPKLLIREAHRLKFDWDVPLPAELAKKFQKWFSQLKSLEKMSLPRNYAASELKKVERTLHVFSDASKEAFAAVAYLRTVDQSGKVIISFVQARNRLAPDEATIPRKELLGCLIAARLAKSIEEALGPISKTFWTDSSTALEWIRKNENWGVFVNNRTKEIRQLTGLKEWKFVPGVLNPADLPSRGADAEKFSKMKWWEGPEFLLKSEDQWPKETKKAAREIVEVELRRTSLLAVSSVTWIPEFKFRGYRRNLRAFAFLLRAVKKWKSHKKKQVLSKNEAVKAAKNVELTASDIEEAERSLWIRIQASMDLKEEKCGDLQLSERNGLLCVNTKLLYRKDAEDFLLPVLLPSSHQVVRAYIEDLHRQNLHAGPGIVTAKLRERVWIRRAMKTVQGVLRRCVICQLKLKKKMEASEVALPTDRVKDARVFEVVGIDYGGPMQLFEKDADGNNKKCWFLLFTCAVYRAVHLELVSGLSTEQLIQALRRFISRRGRPAKIYSDNGTSFQGLDNEFVKINWEFVRKDADLERIEWSFNPPTAAWWGGFWERLVGLVKDLLIKKLRRAQLNFEEMATVLCDVESVLNSRPLTYLSEDSRDLAPLTPNLFLTDLPSAATNDFDQIEGLSFERRLTYRQALKEDLRQRFRDEYLGSLAALNRSREGGSLKVGDVVLVEVDNKKRVNWPLGRVLEIFPGKDGEVRVVKLKTRGGERLRPIQRLVKLELEQLPRGIEPPARTEVPIIIEDIPEDPEEEIVDKKQVVTRSGRVSKAPERWTYLFAELRLIY